MKIGLSGIEGFLASKLQECKEHSWTTSEDAVDIFLHIGSPTFTSDTIDTPASKIMHKYVRDSIDLFDRLESKKIPIVFASSTGVDDIQLDHSGSTSYNLSKLFLENYLIHNCSKYLILRIGTIYSRSAADILAMKPDRIQRRILQGNLSNISTSDYYLDVNVFVNTTLDQLNSIDNRIVEYELDQLSLINLVRLTKNG